MFRQLNRHKEPKYVREMIGNDRMQYVREMIGNDSTVGYAYQSDLIEAHASHKPFGYGE